MWLTNTISHLCAIVTIMARIVHLTLNEKAVKLKNSTIKKVKAEKAADLKRHDLCIKKPNFWRAQSKALQIMVIYQRNWDMRCYKQIMSIEINWIAYKSFKCGQVGKSVLGSKTYTFADSSDFVYA